MPQPPRNARNDPRRQALEKQALKNAEVARHRRELSGREYSRPAERAKYSEQRPAVRQTPGRVRRQRARSLFVSLLLFLVTAAAFLGLGALIKINYADYRWVRDRVRDKEAQLRVLQAQQRAGQRRLAALQFDKGRTQNLMEHGYVPPGGRILLFPASPVPTLPVPTSPDEKKRAPAW